MLDDVPLTGMPIERGNEQHRKKRMGYYHWSDEDKKHDYPPDNETVRRRAKGKEGEGRTATRRCAHERIR
jgi:hypothetical protein